LKRALQTASLVANELAFEGEVQRDEALRPESVYAQFRTLTERYRKLDAIMVVGHNPSLAEFLAKSVSAPSGPAHVELKKGAVAKVDMNGRSGLLEWLVTPRIARTVQSSLKVSSRPKTERK
jgi:phosphohistidine phosphatase